VFQDTEDVYYVPRRVKFPRFHNLSLMRLQYMVNTCTCTVYSTVLYHYCSHHTNSLINVSAIYQHWRDVPMAGVKFSSEIGIFRVWHNNCI
jgi:hypothetical protein